MKCRESIAALATIFTLAALAMVVTGCATDPSLARGVDRKGGGIYSASEMGFNDPAAQAVRQCQLDGNRKVSILTSTTERGISGTNYAVLLFRCD